MTNFQKDYNKRKNIITPESSTIILPAIGGGIIAILLIGVLFTPLSLQNKKNKNELIELQRKRDELPLLESNLKIAIKNLNLKKDQQNRLLNLVAGGKTLDTYIAKIDDIANEFKLKITPGN